MLCHSDYSLPAWYTGRRSSRSMLVVTHKNSGKVFIVNTYTYCFRIILGLLQIFLSRSFCYVKRDCFQPLQRLKSYFLNND